MRRALARGDSSAPALPHLTVLLLDEVCTALSKVTRRHAAVCDCALCTAYVSTIRAWMAFERPGYDSDRRGY